MTTDENSTDTPAAEPRRPLVRFLIKTAAVLFAIFVAFALAVALATALAYRNLPPIDTLTDYRPKIPLRVYTADNVLIGEFGEERRNVVRIEEVPLVMKQAILAAEDERFYQHSGIDYAGILRAAVNNLFSSGRKQGASTITQQVARNFFLSSEQSYVRKFYEILLAFKIEENLTKDQILEVYINQIYLGERAYGFASAERVYYGKMLKDITVAEAAMLAGMPKAPSAYNPVVNPPRAKARQQYVLHRMLALGFLTDEQYKAALVEQPTVKAEGGEFSIHAEYAAEMARQIAYEQFKEETYTRGLSVYTTLLASDQSAAYQALRTGIMDYVKKHGYGGPETFVDLPADDKEIDQAIEDALLEYPDSDDIYAAVVVEAGPKRVVATRQGETIEVTGDGLKFVAQALTEKAALPKRIRRGAVIRVMKDAKGGWEIVELPQVQSALVSASPQDGAIRALIGGFDYSRNKFNHVTQAWRQPGSSFKPFIYSASLEKGFSPSTVINDAPVVLDGAQTGGPPWEPKNYDGKYEGPMRMRQALAKSKNMVSIRILQAIGVNYAQDYITRFGFDADKHPPYLTMALGAGSVTPLQMVGAYSVFANGGFKINPYLIQRITDLNGKDMAVANPPHADDEANRVIDVRNAFITDTMLRDVVRFGTAARAMSLKRNDLAGKTGTTNDSHDAWFAGYSNGNLVGIVWFGYDQPRSLGDRETGGGLALPIWISYMNKALKGMPEKPRPAPDGVINTSGDYYYVEHQPGQGVSSLGLSDPLPPGAIITPLPTSGSAVMPPPLPAAPASSTPVTPPPAAKPAPAPASKPAPAANEEKTHG